jgi:hypothetical protein
MKVTPGISGLLTLALHHPVAPLTPAAAAGRSKIHMSYYQKLQRVGLSEGSYRSRVLFCRILPHPRCQIFSMLRVRQ